MEERRKYARVPVQGHISYKVIPGVKVNERSTRDISQGGIKFIVHEHVPKGSHLKVRLTLPGVSVNFEALVKIIWVKQLSDYGAEEYEVGVSFVDVPRHAAEYLIRYIKACS